LAQSRFAMKTPIYRYWFFLDFLGFSRPNLDLSIGYGDLRAKKFRCPFPGVDRSPARERTVEAMRKAQDYSCVELNTIADFLQSIVVPFGLPSKSSSLRARYRIFENGLASCGQAAGACG
jgi:hypothetical protein